MTFGFGHRSLQSGEAFVGEYATCNFGNRRPSFELQSAKMAYEDVHAPAYPAGAP
jgi:hypothetical protein